MRYVLSATVITTIFTSPAYAYLDPGTGSMILQAIVGGIAVAGTTASVYWSRVKAVFRRKR